MFFKKNCIMLILLCFILLFMVLQSYSMKTDQKNIENKNSIKDTSGEFTLPNKTLSIPTGYILTTTIIWEIYSNTNNNTTSEFFGDNTITIDINNPNNQHVTELFNFPFHNIKHDYLWPKRITYNTNYDKKNLLNNSIKYTTYFFIELFVPFGTENVLQCNNEAYLYSFLECAIIGFFIIYREDLYKAQINKVKKLSSSNAKRFTDMCKTLLNSIPHQLDKKIEHYALKFFPKKYLNQGVNIANYFNENNDEPNSVQSMMKEYNFNIKVISQ